MATDNETTPDTDVMDDEDREVSASDTDQDDAADAGADDDDQELGDAEDSEDAGEGDDEGAPTFTVKVDGRDVTVTLEELQRGYSREADYTRKTQEVAETRKALEARQAELAQQAEVVEEIQGERVQLALVERQLKAMAELNWDELEEEDPKEAARLTRQQVRLQAQRDELSKSVDAKTRDLALKRQQATHESRAQAIEDCQRVLSGKDGIKGWSPQLAEALGDFAMSKLGYTSKEVLAMTDPRMIKAVHLAYKADQAERSDRTKAKLKASDETAPVAKPGANSPGAARRTTDSSGDKLSTAEWMRREQERIAAKRK